MDSIIQILSITIPPIAIGTTVIWIIHSYFKNERDRRKDRISEKSRSTVLPLRLQAYERLVLLLERISPNSMLFRLNQNGQSARQLQMEMLAMVRLEFEHNLSQQLYISTEAWDIVCKAKEETLQIINKSADELDEASGIAFSRKIIEDLSHINIQPTTRAILFLKEEAASIS